MSKQKTLNTSNPSTDKLVYRFSPGDLVVIRPEAWGVDLSIMSGEYIEEMAEYTAKSWGIGLVTTKEVTFNDEAAYGILFSEPTGLKVFKDNTLDLYTKEHIVNRWLD